MNIYEIDNFFYQKNESCIFYSTETESSVSIITSALNYYKKQ